ncbi:MAG: hypothetical protein AB7V45_01760 [Candidatus Krumholzibacteriia bacterium]
MKRTLIIIAALLLMGWPMASALAQDGQPAGQGVCRFIDEDGDGFNDLAPDDDGDGIPNRLDPDYVRPEDGSGRQFGWGRYARLFQMVYGEGIMSHGPAERGQSFGPGEGAGLGEGPGDHTGFGPGSGDGTGDGVDVGGRAQRRGGRR